MNLAHNRQREMGRYPFYGNLEVENTSSLFSQAFS